MEAARKGRDSPMITGALNRFLLTLMGTRNGHGRVLRSRADRYLRSANTDRDEEHTCRYVSTHDVCNESDSYTDCKYKRGGYASYMDMDSMQDAILV